MSELVGPPEFTDHGIITFDLIEPLEAPGMRPDPLRLAEVVSEVSLTLEQLGIKNQPPALSFRPEGESFVMYRVSTAVPGTVALRHGAGAWRGKRGKK